MGCTSSKVDSEDTVRRCRDRRRLMKEAVHSRHHLAAAHSDYLRSLRLTGSALSAFASFQSHLSVSPDLAPTVLLRHVVSADRREYQHQYRYQHPSSPPRAAAAAAVAPAVHAAAAPPPAVKQFAPIPPSPSITSSKVPHILSESSPTSTPEISERRGKNSKRGARKFPYLPENFTYATTPSQASSAWDWEKFYPPSPPGSEYFDRLQKEREREEHGVAGRDDGHLDGHHLADGRDSDVEDDGSDDGDGKLHRREEHQEEVQCSDWRDRYSTSSSSSLKSGGGSGNGDELEDDDADTRSEVISAPRSDLGSSSMDRHRHPHFPHHLRRGPPSEFGSSSATGLSGRKGATAMSTSSSEGPESSIRHERGGAADDHSLLKMVVRHRDLKEIVAAIEEYFAKTAAAGEGVSDLLETGRAQFDRSFRQLKKTVYHSNSVLSNLSASWTSKPPLAIRYRLDTAALQGPAAAGDGGKGSHCSALERLLTWEKKLYKEVKDREGVKIEHEKKLSTLQSLERRGRVDEKLDKTKASIAKLHSQIMVTSQAVSTTSSAIIKVRDNELAPQLLKLCCSFLSMWRSMNELHEVQNKIVQQVRGLVNHAAAIESTSDLLRQATRDLESAISAWHSSFTRIIKHQRDYVRSLYGWLKLTQIQVSNDNSEKDHYSSLVSTELCAFCDEWKQALERLPDTVASEAIKSFVNVVHTISVKQTEELKIRKRAESYSKELEKKTLSLRSIEKKYYQSYSMVGIGLPDGTTDSNGQVLDMRDPLADKKTEIQACRRRVEDEMVRHINAIKVTREMTLNSIQTGLPGVFQAMTSFSGLFAETLEGVCRRAGRLS
ncbi:hypothetical protein Taro_012961 [Colocasia esculenta]|uniref:Uncharacterized protein n=1 Tax=Colocasia esculenta TaxID=4460 RepID=A0A843UF22_COLES|nr:hypothetical protein [Colocasia esculenta]